MRAMSFAVLTVCALAPFTMGRTQALDRAIDMHARAAPDGTPRKLDALELARMAKAAGMRAIVIKNHYEPTASLAFLVRKVVPGIEVFGGISLDLTVGGVNPAAVEWMTKVEGGYGKVIWLPTFDSEAQVKLNGGGRPFAPVTRDEAIGSEAFVLSSDLGQPPNPLHTEGLLAMYKGLMAHGVSAADIDVMARKNPARLLGLDP